MIWTRYANHCQLTKVSQPLTFIITEHGLTFRELGLAVTFKEVVFVCGVELILTEEGLFLAVSDSVSIMNLEINGVEIADTRALTDLILADENFRNNVGLKERRILKQLECFNREAILNLFKLTNGEFMSIRDSSKNSHWIYSQNREVFLPICNKLISFRIFSYSKFCYEEIPVSFTINKEQKTGFLSPLGFIKDKSKLSPNCTIFQSIYLSKTNFSIIRKRNFFEIGTHVVDHSILKFSNFKDYINVEHYKLLKEAVIVKVEQSDYNLVTESFGNVLVDKQPYAYVVSGFEEIIQSVNTHKSDIWNSFSSFYKSLRIYIFISVLFIAILEVRIYLRQALDFCKYILSRLSSRKPLIRSTKRTIKSRREEVKNQENTQENEDSLGIMLRSIASE